MYKALNFIDRFFFAEHLEKGENVIYIIHRHWFYVSYRILGGLIVGVVLPIILFTLVTSDAVLIHWIIIVWSVLGVFYVIYIFADLYGDAWIITDQSIIDVIWSGFFFRSADRINYWSIESVTYKYDGLVATILRFGTLTIRLNGIEQHIIHYAANPRKAQASINAALKKFGIIRTKSQVSNS